MPKDSEKPQEAAKLIDTSIEEEIKQCYIDYAMSVIVSRALPDSRDGLKPVHRRILYAMNDINLTSSSRHKKSAAVVGEVLGKYHPHGDTSVYDALVRMAQSFSMRYPLVDGQGNFGSIDGDQAAAMRYTEAKLTKIAEEMLEDIKLSTVDWRDNYDGSTQEPIMLPTKFPNQLCNGTMGIAVGMATKMAPHNLTEIIDASNKLIDNPEITIDELMEIIQGPDFPTGGFIFDKNKIKEVYAKGKGGITMRGKTHFEEKNGKKIIIIDELPYQVNKAKMVEKIGDLVNEGTIEGITEITDESSKDLIRVSIELSETANPNTVMALIYKYTRLQSNFNINNVVLTQKGKQPMVLNIKELLEEFVNFRKKVVLRRSKHLLEKAQDRLHILNGLQRAIDMLDEVIAAIRGSQTRQEAKEKLMNDFDFSDEQSDYILRLRLQTLVGLEIEKILNEIGDKKSTIERLKEIINNKSELNKVVKKELTKIKKDYGDERRTKVKEDVELNLSKRIDQIKERQDKQKDKMIFWMSNDYELKNLYQSRVNKVPDNTYLLEYTHNQRKLIVITDKGELVIQRVKDLGEHKTTKKGMDIKKHYKFDGNIVYANLIPEDSEEDENKKRDYLVMASNDNSIKKVTKKLLLDLQRFPTHIMKLSKNEKIVNVKTIKKDINICALSENGNILLFKEDEIRPTLKNSGGVKIMDLDENEKFSNIFIHQDEPFVLIHSGKAAKMLSMEDLKVQRRGQKGLIAARLDDNQILKGGMAINEGPIKVKLKGGDVKDLDLKQVKLKTRMTKLDKILDKDIIKTYEPWERGWD